VVYELALPALVVSIVLFAMGAPWYQWLAGVLFAACALCGYTVDIVRAIPFRAPPRWPVLGPYLAPYLTAQMFYWWPLLRLDGWLWAIFAGLYILSTVLNLISHP